MGFIDFAFNWACMAKKLQPYKFIIVSQDPESNVYLKSNTLLSTFDGAAIGVDSTAAQSAWRSPAYNHIVKMKVLIVRQILEMGYHVLFSDVDIVWLDDPLKYFVGDVDWEFEPNELGDDFQPGNTANTGFYWIKSSKKTIDLMKTVEVEAAKVPDLDDQTVWSILLNDFWQNGTYVYVPAAEKSAQDYLLKLNRNDDPLTFRQLNSVQFPPGNKYFGKPRDEWEAESARTGLTAVFGHITFVIGHDIKMQALKDNGMWSVKDGALEEAKAWVENRKQKLGDRWTEIEQLNQNREEGLFCMKQGH
ncbi:nucleotide-diphospho-sugar transferase-domain-containing protein [Fimicolochytrium jonesii]|uniref:nucleotide-diphospho-sugar transferase-domain-containing protein n=1 Tax=Fimicolochytrium jonesii TaxID=1396493 RepID=UPI0022FEEBCB|nr:nucleotide-diphospho-sugar transferase-domain-containing protein [Fimicolochytrium jonesii]KAI8816563.1 nucleotide-diphospho-sugar transferase-domain-containing protein [Fimicolochytrium jonesii]